MCCSDIRENMKYFVTYWPYRTYITRFKQTTDTGNYKWWDEILLKLKCEFENSYPYRRANSYINPVKLHINGDTNINHVTK